MKTPVEIMQIKENMDKLNQSQKLREIRDAYDALSQKDRLIIQTEANSIRKQVKSYLTQDGAVELLSKIGMLMIEKGE